MDWPGVQSDNLLATALNPSTMKFSAEYLRNSGVGGQNLNEDLVLFRRQGFEDQFKFLKVSVVERVRSATSLAR